MLFLQQDGQINEIRCYEEDSRIGNIYVARASNIVSNIKAAFVDIKKGESCYLPLEDWHGHPFKVGDLLVVQVTKDKIKSKQATVTTQISLSGKSVVVHAGTDVVGISTKITDKEVRNTLKQQFLEVLHDFKPVYNTTYGGILRTHAKEMDADSLKQEAHDLLTKLDDLLTRSQYATAYSCLYQPSEAYAKDMMDLKTKYPELTFISDVPSVVDAMAGKLEVEYYQDKSFTLASMYRLQRCLEKTVSKRVYLKSGAYLVIEPTEAMTVIDVNSGKAIKGSNSEEILYKINLEAAKECARQFRLRNLSGIIIIDFINMKEEHNRKRLMQELQDFVSMDSVLTTVVDMTKLGLVEVTRKKIRKALHEHKNITENV